jgi:hypothetical protein
MRLLCTLTLAGLLASCDHHALSRRYPYQTGSSTAVYDAGDPACSATCKTPLGTIESRPSDAELWAGIVGVWQICSGNVEDWRVVYTIEPPDTVLIVKIGHRREVYET